MGETGDEGVGVGVDGVGAGVEPGVFAQPELGCGERHPRAERIRNAQGEGLLSRLRERADLHLHLVHRIDNTTSPEFWHTLSFPDLLPTAPS